MALTKNVSVTSGMYADYRVLGVVVVPLDLDLAKIDAEYRANYKGAWYDYEHDFFKHLTKTYQLVQTEEYFVDDIPWRQELDDNS